jgi:hypothetical protein
METIAEIVRTATDPKLRMLKEFGNPRNTTDAHIVRATAQTMYKQTLKDCEETLQMAEFIFAKRSQEKGGATFYKAFKWSKKKLEEIARR